MEDPKTILGRARSVQRRIDQRQAELKRIREMRSYIQGVDYSAVRVKHTGGRGPVERMAISSRTEELERLLREDVERLAEAKLEAIGLITLLDNTGGAQDVLWEYYIHAMRTWDDVAEQVGYSTRHVLRIHGEALQALRKIMSLNVTPDL